MASMTDIATCLHCNRLISGGYLDRAEAILREHRTHLQSKALAAGGYIEAERGAYGCDSGCEGVRYVVYGARDEEIENRWEFGDIDADLLHEMSDYYGVPIRA
jgi:hypothetical protein